jgi:hypothetical protein
MLLPNSHTNYLGGPCSASVTVYSIVLSLLGQIFRLARVRLYCGGWLETGRLNQSSTTYIRTVGMADSNNSLKPTLTYALTKLLTPTNEILTTVRV